MMSMYGETKLSQLLRTMQPRLNDGQYLFYSIPTDSPFDWHKALLVFREKEGVTLVLEKSVAVALGIYPLLSNQTAFAGNPSLFAWLSLDVHSALEAVGLTAAFAKSLAEAGISANVVAGFYHDHIFVPIADATRAMSVLQALSQGAE
jgi:hypothetical protein